MIKNEIVLEPYGGLGNRIRAIESGIRLACKLNRKLHIIWRINLYSPESFSDIIEEIKECDCRITILDDKYYATSTEKKSKFLSVSNRLRRMFNKLYMEIEGKGKHIDYSGYPKKKYELDNFNKKNMYIYACGGFLNGDVDYKKIVFCKNIEKRAHDVYNGLFGESDYVVGVHIRRGDHIECIENSPLELFVDKMNEIIGEKTNVKFYVCSDEDSIIEQLMNIFADRVMVYNGFDRTRWSVKSQIDAMSEILLLSQCNMVIRSAMSTFALLAAEIGGIKSVGLEKNQNTY